MLTDIIISIVSTIIGAILTYICRVWIRNRFYNIIFFFKSFSINYSIIALFNDEPKDFLSQRTYQNLKTENPDIKRNGKINSNFLPINLLNNFDPRIHLQKNLNPLILDEKQYELNVATKKNTPIDISLKEKDLIYQIFNSIENIYHNVKQQVYPGKTPTVFTLIITIQNPFILRPKKKEIESIKIEDDENKNYRVDGIKGYSLQIKFKEQVTPQDIRNTIKKYLYILADGKLINKN